MLRFLAAVALCAFSAVVTLEGVYGFAEGLHGGGVRVRLQVLRNMETFVARLALHRERPLIFRAAFLGDSTVVSYPSRARVPDRLQEHYSMPRGLGRIVEVHSLGAVGLSSFEFYFFADRIIEAKPDVVIMPVNLTTTSDRWRMLRSQELSAWLPPERIPEALTLPLHWIGLTTDQLLAYVTLEHLGGFDRWLRHRVAQTRVGATRDALVELLATEYGFDAELDYGEEMDAWAAHRDTVDGKEYRFTVGGALASFGQAFAGVDRDHAMLIMCEAAVSAYVRAGIPVIAYIVPTNVDHFRQLGLLDEERWRTTLEHTRTALKTSGATVLDLHDMFPDSAFRDPVGHFLVSEDFDGPVEVAARLEPLLTAAVREHVERAR